MFESLSKTINIFLQIIIQLSWNLRFPIMSLLLLTVVHCGFFIHICFVLFFHSTVEKFLLSVEIPCIPDCGNIPSRTYCQSPRSINNLGKLLLKVFLIMIFCSSLQNKFTSQFCIFSSNFSEKITSNSDS